MKIPAKKNKRIVCIVGPTASGKTTLAVSLAKKFNGEIISADSRQVYKGLDIGTGKDLQEYGKIKYHLIDVTDPMADFTLFDWLIMANNTINEIISRGGLPIVVGGTGLYVQALVEGFTQTQGEKNKGKKYTRGELDEKNIEQLRKIYSKLQINDSNLDRNNPRRLIRAIEKAQEGTIFSKNKPDFKILQIGITLPRSVLYKKIDTRVDQRFQEGMLEEVRGLIESGVDPAWLDKLGLEYRIISEYLTENSKFKSFNLKSNSNDEIFEDKQFQEMSQNLKWRIHAYARRQLTWFKRFKEIVWVENINEASSAVKNFLRD